MARRKEARHRNLDAKTYAQKVVMRYVTEGEKDVIRRRHPDQRVLFDVLYAFVFRL